MKDLKDARSNSSSLVDGVVHRGIALAISGFGTIISIIVGILTTIMYPFSSLRDKKNA